MSLLLPDLALLLGHPSLSDLHPLPGLLDGVGRQVIHGYQLGTLQAGCVRLGGWDGAPGGWGVAYGEQQRGLGLGSGSWGSDNTGLGPGPEL